MRDERRVRVFELIDAVNGQDPNMEVHEGVEQPRERLYGERMSSRLERLDPDASDLLKIAARGQHIARWEVPRGDYPATRAGYLKWRTYLYRYHGERVAELMTQAGYDDEAARRVRTLLEKRGLKTDPDVQTLEDTACLVFIEHYLADFAPTQGEQKLIGIIQKTWNKMSARGRDQALALPLSEPLQTVLAKALAL